MKLVYMGTPQFAVEPLSALLSAGHTIAGVVTRVDKPAGRGRALAAPPVKQAAQARGLPVHQPKRIRDRESVDLLRTIGPDAIIVAAYGQILPKEILVIPRFGCINIHASLLPFYRGAAPVNWAIVRGERETGITIMQMDEGMDTGAILVQERIPIAPDDTAGTLTGKLSALGAKLMVHALPLIASGDVRPTAQDGAKASLAPPLKKRDGLIDWQLPASEIHNRVRGLSPWPGAYSYLNGKMIRMIVSEPVGDPGESGVVYVNKDDVLEVGAGRGRLRIIRLQPEGKKPMTAAEFLRGHQGVVGKKFENP